jgi:anti-repressor protein
MENLITITTNEQGSGVVSARELHQFLEVKTDFKDWMPRMLEYGFEENKDFSAFLSESTGGRPSKEFALTIDTAKEISMIQRSEKGKEARQYFIQCEKIAKEVKILSPLDIMQIAIDQLKSQESRISKTEQAVLMLEARTTTRSNYFTIAGFATLNKINCGLKLASSLGKRASALCNQRNIPTEDMPDPRFGKVKLYPVTILEEVFSMSLV